MESKQVAEFQKQLRIKGGLLKRCTKEYTSYQEESKALEEKLQKLKDEGAEEGKIRQADEALAETAQMLPNCIQKVQAGIPDLEGVIEMCKDAEEI